MTDALEFLLFCATPCRYLQNSGTIRSSFCFLDSVKPWEQTPATVSFSIWRVRLGPKKERRQSPRGSWIGTGSVGEGLQGEAAPPRRPSSSVPLHCSFWFITLYKCKQSTNTHTDLYADSPPCGSGGRQ